MKDVQEIQVKKYKQIVKTQIDKLALEYLNRKKNKHKKVKKLRHDKIQMAEYLEPNNHKIKINEAQLLFKLKSKMTNVKTNYSGSFKDNLNCDLCQNEGKKRRDTQKHTLICPVINRDNVENNYSNYKSIRKGDIIDQLKVVRKFKINFEIGKTLKEKLKTT